ncbi:MAG: hypothetical protein AAFS10_27565 [Myxococcota bacterium]
MKNPSRILIPALIALIALLTVHLVQTGAPQALVSDMTDAIGVHTTMAELRTLEEALERELHSLPDSAEQTHAWVKRELNIARDHWGSSYRFIAAASGATIIRSDGPDRIPNTFDDLEVRIRRP